MMILCLTFGTKVKASTITPWATKQVKIQTCDGNGTCTWSSNYDANHNFTGSDLQYPVTALEWRVKTTDGMLPENSYTFSFGYKPTPDAIMYQEVFMRRNAQSSKEDITCTQSMDSNSYYTWNCTFSPLEEYTSSQWLYIQVKFYQAYLTGINTKITGYDERLGINSIVTQQTNKINESINNILDEDHDYSEAYDPYTSQAQQKENEWSMWQTQIKNNIDISNSNTLTTLTINATSSQFIWGIVDMFRSLSSKIILLITSILSLGIIKMVLNR